ncbi:MAG: hypothetical protein E4G90_00780 [Gemmatimonadales bacterium]|nr:MAG: hypothetical protein E4G90_00780 [Gemmatimonadales bacterium]
METQPSGGTAVPWFDRAFLSSENTFTRIGGGSLGGKAEGLILISNTLRALEKEEPFRQVELGIPRLTVLGTDVFDAFMERNDLFTVAFSDRSDERIAHAFQRADLPSAYLGDLRELIEHIHSPLAVRSSSLLEDALRRPFAGVYETKMIPNNQPEGASRFQRLTEAVKFVFASTFFRSAKSYRQATGAPDESEKMAVMIQEVLGERRGDRFYPHVSLVCRSYSYYPTGRAKPEQGVVSLALGLGKTIVDGGVCWSYCPAYPKAPPPFGSARQMFRDTQSRFWSVNMGPPPKFDPVAETEYLREGDLGDAEYDGTLANLVSTYDPGGDRFNPGMGQNGPRVLDFSPLLKLDVLPLNQMVRDLLSACEKTLEAKVEMEMALVIPSPRAGLARLGFLQVRPMVAPDEAVEIQTEELSSPATVVSSLRSMGNGIVEGIQDVVYTKPGAFDAKHTRRMASEIEKVNRALLGEGRPYLLIGFGRWGSSDPWLGIPVTWGMVSGAKAIVEATLPSMNVEPSQGSHFFHNLSSLEVSYFTVSHSGGDAIIDWPWFDHQNVVSETEFIKHIRVPAPLRVRVDGRTGRGLVERPRPPGPETVEREERSDS